jgi:ankyrin repeat protein
VQYIAEHGADINAFAANRVTPVQIAAARGHAAVLEFLISFGAKINNRRKGETSALLFAIRKRNLEIVRILLSAKADVNYADGKGETPLIAAIISACSPELINLLLDHNAQVDAVTADHRNALAIAIEKGNTTAFDLLSEVAGQDWSFVDGVGRTLLHLAVENGTLNFIEKVLCHANQGELDLDAQDAEGDTPLHIAVRGDSTDIIRALMSAGCDPAKVNRRRQNAFTTATDANAAYITELLLDPEIAETRRVRREQELERQIEAEQQRLQDRRAKTESLWKGKSETPKKGPLAKSSRAKLATMTVQGGRVRSKESPSEKGSEPRKPIEARPWGGSIETELFQRQVRLKLREFKREVRGWLEGLERDINDLRDELLGEAEEEDHIE